MARYVARRLVEVAVALFAISTLVFLILHFKPGGPCNSGYVLPNQHNYQPVPSNANCADFFHLDQPLVTQYLDLVGGYLHGNLGVGLDSSHVPVATTIGEHLPTTLLLLTTSFLLQQLIAIPLGVMAAVKRHSVFDGAFSVFSYGALSTPAFILGFTLLWVVTVVWGVLPPGHASDDLLPVLLNGSWFAMLPHHPALLLGDMLRHLILPATTLAMTGIAIDSRFLRAAMLQVLDEEYIRMARAKGLTRRTIIFKHALRNALPPVITNIALYFPALIGTAMVVETVFSYQGIGYTFTQAILRADTALEQAIFLLSTAAVLLANLAADVVYALADPRVRYE